MPPDYDREAREIAHRYAACWADLRATEGHSAVCENLAMDIFSAFRRIAEEARTPASAQADEVRAAARDAYMVLRMHDRSKAWNDERQRVMDRIDRALGTLPSNPKETGHG